MTTPGWFCDSCRKVWPTASEAGECCLGIHGKADPLASADSLVRAEQFARAWCQQHGYPGGILAVEPKAIAEFVAQEVRDLRARVEKLKQWGREGNPKTQQWPFGIHQPGKCRMDDGHACTCEPPYPMTPTQAQTARVTELEAEVRDLREERLKR